MQLYYWLLALLYSGSASARFTNYHAAQSFISTKDSRPDGISYEIDQVLVTEHLQATSSTSNVEGPSRNVLEDLKAPGTQHLLLNYLDHWACRRTDYLLRIISDITISKESEWVIDVRGALDLEGNMTFVAEILVIIGKLPAIAKIHWNTQRFIPVVVLESLQENHPDCRLYYTIPIQTLDANQTPDELAFNRDGNSPVQKILGMEHQQVVQPTTPQSILRSKNLYSLTAHIDYDLSLFPEKLDLVHQILLTCPNVRELDLTIYITTRKSNEST